jgi:hypothetical protein
MRAFVIIVALFVLAQGSPGRSVRGERRSERRDQSRSVGTSEAPRSRSVGGHLRASAPQCASCERDEQGRIRRNPSARREFVREHPCPATGKSSGRCPGYVVDHVVPLKRGAADTPDNMQWQTREDAKAKDRVE